MKTRLKKIIPKLSLSIFTLIFSSACNQSLSKVAPSEAINGAQSVNSFQALSDGIFAPKCMSCHSGGSPSGNVDLSSYNSIVNSGGNLVVPGKPEASALYLAVANGSMPKNGSPLSNEELQTIAQWIQDGAPSGDFSPSPGPSPTPAPVPTATPVAGGPTPTPTPGGSVAYATIQTNIFNQSCTGCHSGSRPSSGVNLSSYAALMANSKQVVVAGSASSSLVYTQITSGSMPPSGSVSSANLMLLQEWINQGAKP